MNNIRSRELASEAGAAIRMEEPAKPFRGEGIVPALGDQAWGRGPTGGEEEDAAGAENLHSGHR